MGRKSKALMGSKGWYPNKYLLQKFYLLESIFGWASFVHVVVFVNPTNEIY